MPIRLSNLRLGVDESESALPERLASALQLKTGDIRRWRILRKSLDARDKSNIHFVYSAEVEGPPDENAIVARAARRRSALSVDLFTQVPFPTPVPGASPLEHRPIVVGAGPAGLFAAWFLAEQGYRPLILERGRMVRERIRDVRELEAGGPPNAESNYLFGEGGAGTFSDGKLTCRGSGPDVQRVLEIFAECKGKPSIVYEHRPHLGSNRLPAVVKALRRRIEAMGGEFEFEVRVEDLMLAEGRVISLATSNGVLPCQVAVLAIGHSARDTYQMLHARGVPMVQKAFQFGVRIEQPQEQVNRSQYGPAPLEEKLGAADYSVVARGPRDLFSFCMCAGGQVIPSVSEPGCFSTNGMSLSRRSSPFANSGMMVTIAPEEFGGDHPLSGVELQRRYESIAFDVGRREYLCPIQRADDYLARRATRGRPASSYSRGVISARIADMIPDSVDSALRHGLPALDRRWRGLFLRGATIVGPEARGSSPVRFPRDSRTMECEGVVGLYPIGEGAGYAGGIVSAAVDGLRAARAIITRYAPLESRNS